jgi:CrcB protein
MGWETLYKQKEGAGSSMIVLATITAGGLGAVLRFWLGQLFGLKMIESYTPIPVGILLINVLGSFGLGMFTHFHLANDTIVTIISTGFFGGFTTFSTFSVEAVQLIIDRKEKEAAVYVLLSIAGSAAAFWAGVSIS